MLSLLSLFGGLIFLVFGAEGLVRGSAALALRAGVTPLLVGLTLVAFGTSAPELATSVMASMQDRGALVTGNILGSNLFNTLMVVGMCALIARTGHPLTLPIRTWRNQFPLLLGITLLGIGALWGFNPIPRWIGGIALCIFGAYVVWAYHLERRTPHPLPVDIQEAKRIPLWLAGCFLGFGIVGLTLGAKLFLAGVLILAKTWGFSDGFTGVALVACGTALPELMTSLVATKRRQTDLAIGNVVGSNIFNILGILGISSLVRPLPVPSGMVPLGVGILLAATLGLMLHTRIGGCRMTRLEGGLFVAAYGLALFALWKLA